MWGRPGDNFKRPPTFLKVKFMGKMKDSFIDQINNSTPDDTDWDAPKYDSAGFTEADRNPNDVSPIQIDQATGKKLWIVKSIKDDVEYKIWAYTYQQALELLPMIENF